MSVWAAERWKNYGVWTKSAEIKRRRAPVLVLALSRDYFDEILTEFYCCYKAADNAKDIASKSPETRPPRSFPKRSPKLLHRECPRAYLAPLETENMNFGRTLCAREGGVDNICIARESGRVLWQIDEL